MIAGKILVVFVAAFCLTEGHRFCCFPDEMSGQIFNVQEQRFIFFNADYKTGKVYESEDQEGNSPRRIYDITKGKVFEFNGTECRSAPIARRGGLLKQCVADTQWSNRSLTVGGPESSQKVNGFTDNKVGNSYTYHLMDAGNAECYPIYSFFQSDSGHTISEVYHNIRPWLPTDLQYDALDNCL